MSRVNEGSQEVKYVYDLPYSVRKQLCNILDCNDDWEKLGGIHMGRLWSEIQEFRRAERCGESPTNRLLQAWGQQNHTVKELFLYLWRMDHFQAMRVLQPCVPEKYHKLCNVPDLQLSGIFVETPVNTNVSVKPMELEAVTRLQQIEAASHRHNATSATALTNSTTPADSVRHNTIPAITFGHNFPHATAAVSIASPQRAETKYSSLTSQDTSGNMHSDRNNGVEGACALNSSHDNNLQTLDEKPSNFNLSPSKVPQFLLSPVNDMSTSAPRPSTLNQPVAQMTPAALSPPIGAIPKRTGSYMPHPGVPINPWQAVPRQTFPMPSAASKALPSVINGSNHKQILNPHPSMSTIKEVYPMPSAAHPNKAFPSLSGVSSCKQPLSLSNGEVEKKINNNEGQGIPPEVSCEDNNREEMKTKTSKAPYDPDQDYLNKLEEKRAREAAREAQCRRPSEGSSSTSSSSQPSVVQTQPGSSPASPNQQHQQLQQQQQQQQQQQSRSRKISNVSDAESPYSSVPVIPYKELEEATALWSHHNLLGRGGFGAVYRGTWKNTEVAIKRIEPHANAHMDNSRIRITQSLDELKLLQSYRHDNILQVYGYSTDHELYPCLVYQFMPHGSLEDRLQRRVIEGFGESSTMRGPDVLGWRQRFRVTLGTAGALQFLHTVKEKPLIHGDVKSANILLDQNYEPKLGDFGLAREGKSCSTSLLVSRVHGTKPYLPVDYLRSKKLSVKVDTYSFGIVLFEVCTGLRAFDDKRSEKQKFLWEMVEEAEEEEEALRDKKLLSTHEPEVFPFLLKLGKKCAKQRASRRPDMTDVFKDLENFKVVMEERARARRISMGESSSGGSTPHLLQVRYDTAGSLHSPSTFPSFPYHFHHQPSSPSGASTMPPSSPGIPRSPVPPVASHYYPHPLARPTYPGMVVNGQVAFHPRMFPAPSQPPWMHPPADMMCGVPPPPTSNAAKYYVPHNMSPGAGMHLEVQDPPSYSEAISQPSPGAVGAAVSHIIPQLSGLNVKSSSESEFSDVSETRSSLTGHTAQSVMGTVTPHHDPPAAVEGGGNLPLLSALNNTDDSSS